MSWNVWDATFSGKNENFVFRRIQLSHSRWWHSSRGASPRPGLSLASALSRCVDQLRHTLFQQQRTLHTTCQFVTASTASLLLLPMIVSTATAISVAACYFSHCCCQWLHLICLHIGSFIFDDATASSHWLTVKKTRQITSHAAAGVVFVAAGCIFTAVDGDPFPVPVGRMPWCQTTATTS